MSVYRVGSNKSSNNVFPSVRPTLDLDFANSKTLDPRITYSRASGGSYVGPDGFIKYAGVNEPRFTYDQNTGESLGLMIEDGGTNLLTGSEDFGPLYWVRLNSVDSIANQIISPDGNLTADKFVENTNTSHKVLARNFTAIANNTYTFSIFVKAAERSSIMIHVRKSDYSDRFGAVFNLKTQTITPEVALSGTLNNSSIVKYPNDWYRISVSGNIGTNTAAVVTMYLIGNSGPFDIGYLGDGVSGMYVWGAQLETQTFPITVPSSYIPTQASTRTRARDDTEIRGKNFSDFYNQNGGTVYSDITVMAARAENTSNFSFDRAYSFTNSNFNLDGIDITIFKAGTQRFYIFGVTDNTVDLGNSILGSFLQYPRAKTCVSFTTRNITAYLNNNKAPQAFPRKLITCDRLFLGKPQRFQLTPYIIISRFTYYPRQLPEEQIRILTR